MNRQSAQQLQHETDDLLFRTVARDVDFHALHRAYRERYPFLLQSTAINETLGTCDILFARSETALVLDQLQALKTVAGSATVTGSGDFLEALDHWWQTEQCETAASRSPFHGGWFLYLGYELAGQVEPSLQLQTDTLLPTAFAARCPAALVREHVSGDTYVVCEREFAEIADQMTDDIESCPQWQISDDTVERVLLAEEDPALFIEAVCRAKEYIAAGDVYQANLSRKWSADNRGGFDADRIYRRLREANPGPFAGMISWDGASIVSSSPERLISVTGRTVMTRPIAGTRPRGSNSSDDTALSEELFGHPKERAEHVMLIDLERNDLGRICTPGSVTVDEFMVLESYAHVHHIVSNVTGELKSDVTPGDAIRAVFPGGTITGCPKVRCMEIISELEQGPRGAYTGSFGYLNRDGSLDLNILIRSIVMRGDHIELRAGSGIVADSDPDAELAETRAKAKGLLMAVD